VQQQLRHAPARTGSQEWFGFVGVTKQKDNIMDIDIDFQIVIDELLERNKSLTLENIILKKALEQIQESAEPSEESNI
jgi:regulator of replication initiation timing